MRDCDTLGVCRAVGETCPAGKCRGPYPFAPGTITAHRRRAWWRLTPQRAQAIGSAGLFVAGVAVIVAVCGFSSGYFGRVWGWW
jgi:hypothetical protein